ncbi:PQQ-like beta-propeller repeat protein [Streptomyces sp. N2-109]|uniref:PQQ-like beta-propeller repeat protein n=2 Tax=Streptomyces gossypii TaxID=2883101 RepID=A0ABT2K491_9ACTN|nr:PQQ-like beta-propeller repeat protein [Streptomyces gossypii]
MLAGAAFGTAGVAVGGAVAWAVTAEGPPVPPTPAQRLVMERRSRKRVKGAPPRIRWRYEVPGTVPKFAPVIWQDKTVVVVNESGVSGVGVRTGEKEWHQSEVSPAGPAEILGDDLLAVPGPELTLLDPQDGHVVARPKDYRRGGKAPYLRFLATAGGVIWFTARDRSAASGGGSHLVVAYDVTERRELWRSRVPGPFTEGHLLPDVLVTAAAEGKGRTAKTEITALNRRTGKKAWSRAYEGLTPGPVTEVSGRQLLIAVAGAELRGYDLRSSDDAPEWSVKTKGKEAEDRRVFGPPVVHKHMVYATDSSYAVYAVDPVKGDVTLNVDPDLWISPAADDRLPDTLVGSDGRLMLSVNDSEVDAFDIDRGALLWRFTDLPRTTGRTPQRRMVSLTDEMAVVTSGGDVYGLLLD